jgi:hypothetical protein
MEVKRISKNNWLVEVTSEDKKRIACIVNKLMSKTELPPYGRWKNKKLEEIWEELLGQFCVMRGTDAWDKLKEKKVEYREFLEIMKLENLVNRENRIGFLRETFRKYKPTILVKKPEKETSPHPDIPDRIEQFLNNKNAVKEGKLILFDGLDNLTNEDEIRDILLRRCCGSFKMKSISDFMIEIGMARSFIAFDTRIVGILNRHFGPLMDGNPELKKVVGKIQSNEALYKTIERKLRDVCKKIGIELSLLDRMLFRFSSAIEYILETECARNAKALELNRKN